MECLSDTRERTPIVLNRTRGVSIRLAPRSNTQRPFADVVNSMNYSAYYGGPITVDQENTVKAYSLAPAMLGRGHKYLEPNGPIWVIFDIIELTQDTY